ncbi:hypothetical protein J5Y04_31315 [Kitasatospora sp. RG8]|uniref:hypothetical protein n=1 Tax=Kitasatospora sp. RG8 TaxID=2820815 RepID=UPI001ADF9E41|nr:hypothetical protein [Kitasatospora sp. RG8]MBP0453998.1 hypothetical protein [Kitasatospora sp. RG8]
MTETARTRTLRAALDAADNIATITAATTAGLTTYRALTGRPTETRLTLAAAAAGLAACLTDQATLHLRTPLRCRLGIQPAYGPAAEAGPAPTLEQLTIEVAADAAHRAATGAHALDRSSGSLTQATNWVGAADGTATCELPGGAHLLCVPSPTDHGYSSRTYLLVRGDEQPLEVRSITELAALLDSPAADTAQPADSEAGDGDPWAALGQTHAIAELCNPAADGDDQADEDDIDQEAQAHAADLL